MGARELNRIIIMSKSLKFLTNITYLLSIILLGFFTTSCEEEEIQIPDTLSADITITAEQFATGDYEGLLVRIEDVQFQTIGEKFNPTNSNSTGSRTVEECATGNTFIVFTGSDRAFANETVPSGRGAIIGIASSFDDRPQLLLRGKQDWADMNNENRCGGIENCEEKNGEFTNLCFIRNAFTIDGASSVVGTDTKIRVTVTSDKDGGNINTSNAFAEDASAGIVLRFAATHSFEVGDVLEVEVAGLELSEFNGLLQINNIPLANASSTGNSPITPTVVTISEFNTGNYEGRLVTIENISYADAGSNFYAGSGSGTNRDIADTDGNTTEVRTGSGASFASETIPSGTVSVTGNAGEFNGNEQLLPRNATDVGASGGGGGGDPATLETIANVRALFSGSATNITSNIKIRGVVTSDKDNGSITGRNIYIQDASGAIAVRFTGNNTFALNDEIEIELQGRELSEFNDLLQVNNVPNGDATGVSSTIMITPAVVSVADILTGNYEGQLVQINNITYAGADGTATFPSNNAVSVSDASGSIDMFVRSDFSTLGSTVLPTGTVSDIVVHASTFNGIQILPRAVSEVE